MTILQTAENMLEFIQKSPTCFHAIASCRELLEAEGYREWKEEEEWSVEAGGKYYVTRNDSSLIALHIPEHTSIKGFHMAASHSDSPTFKVKDGPTMQVEGHYVKLNTEKYGGMILSTWLDRPLSIAGRLVVKNGEELQTRLVNIDRDLLVIPNVAIHMNREMNKGVEYNPQIDMLPLLADASMHGSLEGGCMEVREGETAVPEERCKAENMLLALAAQAAGVAKEDILGHDLFLYVRDKGRILGAGGEFVLSPRLDDLQCVYTSLQAFLQSRPQEYINVCAVFDNEEVGSSTKQGADSTFLEDVLVRCAEAMGMTPGSYRRLVAGSFLISADNAHAVHPNHPEKADPVNRPYLNGGLVIKYHGSQKYTTDAFSSAKMKELCRKAGVPCQIYTNRSDIAGGSTLGNISTAHVSVASVDIGLPQLAMHSAVETAGIMDTWYGIAALKEFYQE